jgi:pyrroline-5-carboxylate reductase
MGCAVVRGLRDADASWSFCASVRHADTAQRLEGELGVPVSVDNVATAEAGDVVLIAVKPQAVGELFEDGRLADALAGKLVISICAGVSLSRLQALAPDARFARAMPNTPALIREGMTVVSLGRGVTEADGALARAVFSAVGRCRVLDEKHLDAVTGLSGSGPAFAFVMLESLADGGVMMGLPRDVAVELAAQTMQGAARLVLETGVHPAALRDSVTTPAGCTIAGLFVMEDGKIRSTLARTVQEAARVAGGLGKP